MSLLEIARRRPVWWYLGTALLVTALRLPTLEAQSLDFRHFLAYWWDAAGSDPISALTGNVHNYDYTPVYIGILVVLHPVLGGLAPVVAIKLISVAGDIACALIVGRIVGHFRPDPAYSRVAFAVVLLLPTVTLDSSVFGQVDSLYTALLLGCVLALLRGRQQWAMIAFGLALAFKFQAVFLAPALAALVLLGVIKWRHLWVAPAAMLAAFVPAMAAGRSLFAVLGTYTGQAGEYPFLTLNAPNAYGWWQRPITGTAVPGSGTGDKVDIQALVAAYPRVGHDTILILTACAMIPCALLVLYVWRHRRALVGRPDQSWIVLLCAVSAMLAPYVLPSMHERYFYPSDLLVLTLAFIVPTTAVRVTAFLALLSSTVAYTLGWFVFDGRGLPLGIPGTTMGVALLLLVRELVRATRSQTRQPDAPPAPLMCVRTSAPSPFGGGGTVHEREAADPPQFLVSRPSALTCEPQIGTFMNNIIAALVALQTRLIARDDERGATAVEYGLLVALIAAVIIAIVVTLGGQISNAFTSVTTSL